MELISTVVVHEIYSVFKEHKTFERKHFVTALNQLPKLPYEEES